MMYLGNGDGKPVLRRESGKSWGSRELKSESSEIVQDNGPVRPRGA